MKLSVIIPTYGRPDCIRNNLEALAAQLPPPAQVILVDASPDDRTKQVVAECLVVGFPFELLYLRNPAGRGNTPNSRNVALGFVKGEIAAFLDDDAFVRVGWAAAMIGSYADSSVAGVAGRALNGIRGEEDLGLNEIGKLKPNGFLTGNFAANPGNIVEVDHAIGCNMSLRREVVQRLGGFRDDYRAGPFGICEETEIFVRAKRLGYRFIFNPDAIVDHIGAPQPGRRRFSPTYSYYHSRNLMTMLVRNFGWRIITFRHAGASSAYSIKDFLRKMAGAAAHLICGVAGVVVGMIAGTWLLVIRGSDPIRSDAVGEEIRTALAAQEAASTLKSTALSPMVTASGVKISRDVALESRPNC